MRDLRGMAEANALAGRLNADITSGLYACGDAAERLGDGMAASAEFEIIT